MIAIQRRRGIPRLLKRKIESFIRALDISPGVRICWEWHKSDLIVEVTKNDETGVGYRIR